MARLGQFATVANLRVELGDAVWVRTPEANVKLSGQVALATQGDAIVPEGEISANRGQYRLDLGVVQRGFSIDDIAIVSIRGRERSLLQGLDRLGSWTLRHFTGRFDESGNAAWSDGELLIESVRRFKGQAATAVVLTECDMMELDAMNRRLLFVGLTRARVHLEWVASGATADLLAQTL